MNNLNDIFDYFAGGNTPITVTIMVMIVLFLFLVLMIYLPILTRKFFPKFAYLKYASYLPFVKINADNSMDLSNGACIRVYRVAGIQTSMQDNKTKEKSAKEIWEECVCDSLGDMNIFAGDEIVSKFMAPAISEVKAATENEAKSPTQTRGSPEGKASRETAKRSPKVPPRSDYATNAMQWAYSVKTSVGEQKIFYRKGKWVLLEKSEDGFVEIGQYTSRQYDFISKEINKHNEELYDRGIDESIHQSALLYDNLGNGNSRNNRNDVE